MIYIYLLQTSHNKPNFLRPNWFSYEKCFSNLLTTIGYYNLRSKDKICLNIHFDGKLMGHFTEHYRQCKYINNIIQFNSGGDGIKSYLNYLKEIKNNKSIKDNDIIYTLENDYLHQKNSLLAAQNIFDLLGEAKDNFYVSLYDHADKYLFTNPNAADHTGMYKNLSSKIIHSDYCHWRTTPSTCSSFLITKKTFNEDYDIHSTGESDAGRFDKLTKQRGRVVLSALPGFSTHCVNPFMSPLVDWEKVQNEN